MPKAGIAFPDFTFLVTLTGQSGVSSTLGGFQQAIGLKPGADPGSAVRLQRGVVNSEVFNQWISAERISAQSAERTVVIAQRGLSGQTMMTFQLANASPASYTGPALGRAVPQAALEQLVLTVQRIEIVAPQSGATYRWSGAGRFLRI